MRRISSFLLAAVATCGLASATAARAEETPREWELTLTPYLWLAYPTGDVHAKSNNQGPNVNFPEVDFKLDDISLSGVFTGSADFRYQNFGAFADLTYFSIKGDKNITVPGDIFLNGEVKVSGTKGMLMGYWRAWDSGASQIDLMAGMHYLKPELTLSVATVNRGISRKVSDSWVDPLIGVRGSTQLTDHFGLNGFATYGGFGVNSDSLYDLYAAAHWRFNQTFTLSLGWRYFADKFSGNKLDYDVNFNGPLAGFSFAF